MSRPTIALWGLCILLFTPAFSTAQTIWQDGFEARAIIDVELLNGRIELPPSSALDPTTLTVENLLQVGNPVGADGSFELLSAQTGPQLATVVSDAGHPLLLGFFGPDRTELSTRSTAEALVYLAVGGSYTDPWLHVEVLQRIASSGAEFDNLVSTLDNELISDPALLLNGSTTLTGALEDVVNDLLTLDAMAKRVLVNPQNRRSGLDVIQGFQRISLQNSLRRPAQVYLDRQSCTKDGGSVSVGTSDCPQFSRQLPVSSIAGIRSLPDAIADVGRIIVGLDDELPPAWVPTTTDPLTIAIPPQTEGATYRLQAIGPGQSPGAFDQLSPDRQEKARQINIEYILTYFVGPFIANLVAPLEGNTVSEVLANRRFIGQITALLLSNSTFANALNAGDFRLAGQVAIREIGLGASRGAFIEALISAIAIRNASGAQVRRLSEFVADRVANVTLALDLINLSLTASDVSVAGQAFRDSNAADEWEIEVLPDSVSLGLVRPVATCTEPAELQAFINFVTVPSDVRLEYRFSTTSNSGQLVDPSNGGISSRTELVLDGPRVNFVRDDLVPTPTVPISVKVLALADGTTSLVGEASNFIQIEPLNVAITPRLVSLQNGQEINLVASVRNPTNTVQNEGCLSGVEPSFEWETTGNFGSLDIVQGAPLFRDNATYTAGNNGLGVDTVTVRIYSAGEFVGEASAEIRVEDMPTVVFGTLDLDIQLEEIQPPNGSRSCLNATIIVPDLPGAQTFRLSAYNGFDPLFFGPSIIDFAPPFDDGFGINYTQEDRRMLLSGSCGGTEGITEVSLPSFQDRFEHPPWIWEIVVTY